MEADGRTSSGVDMNFSIKGATTIPRPVRMIPQMKVTAIVVSTAM